jgi:primosomal protein N' (replication factor Y)
MEGAVRELLPTARVLRMDSDAVAGKDGYFKMLDRISRREVDVVVGTQMVAKGHDLPGVTLVGVVLADLGLSLPDFRAAERTFQVLTQVAGRAGRGKLPGRVIIQTFQPDHYAIQLAQEQDFEKFYELETRSREKFFYPPSARLANFRLTGRREETVKKAASALGQLGRRLAKTKAFADRVRLLGPARAPIGRIQNKTRWMMLVKADGHETMSRFVGSVFAGAAQSGLASGVDLELDRDPMMIM